jgi:hypothetical protein
MKPIKNVTFEALDNFANEIFYYTSANYDYIKLKIADFLVTDGNKEFVKIYNDLANTNDYKEAIKKLKIE